MCCTKYECTVHCFQRQARVSMPRLFYFRRRSASVRHGRGGASRGQRVNTAAGPSRSVRVLSCQDDCETLGCAVLHSIASQSRGFGAPCWHSISSCTPREPLGPRWASCCTSLSPMRGLLVLPCLLLPSCSALLSPAAARPSLASFASRRSTTPQLAIRGEASLLRLAARAPAPACVATPAADAKQGGEGGRRMTLFDAVALVCGTAVGGG